MTNDDEIGRENFQLVHFLAVRSAAYWLNPTKIWFHLPEGTLEPTGMYPSLHCVTYVVS
jgi:hypothetical protein